MNQYKLDSIASDAKTIVFISEAIENIEDGWRAKENLSIEKNEFVETFELAPPMKNLKFVHKQRLKENHSLNGLQWSKRNLFQHVRLA